MFDNSIGGFSGILHSLWNWGAEAANPWRGRVFRPRPPSLNIHTRDRVADPLPFPASKRQPEPQLYFTLRIGRRKAQRLAGREGGSTVNIEGPALG
jgi:hypothetical protein